MILLVLESWCLFQWHLAHTWYGLKGDEPAQYKSEAASPFVSFMSVSGVDVLITSFSFH